MSLFCNYFLILLTLNSLKSFLKQIPYGGLKKPELKILKNKFKYSIFVEKGSSLRLKPKERYLLGHSLYEK